MCDRGLHGRWDVHENWALSCPESSLDLSGQDNHPMLDIAFHWEQPRRRTAAIAPANGTSKLFRLQASITLYIPEENSMALVFPET
jgi:hypothetical protein